MDEWERLWARVDWDPDEPGRCWLWLGGKQSKGYGILPWKKPGETQLVHRYVYQEMVGPLLPGMVIMHSCDTPACCNPGHLRQGTISENQQDMVQKGRSKAKNWGQGGTCVNGHLWAENEYFYKRRRVCRACKMSEQRRRRAR